MLLYVFIRFTGALAAVAAIAAVAIAFAAVVVPVVILAGLLALTSRYVLEGDTNARR